MNSHWLSVPAAYLAAILAASVLGCAASTQFTLAGLRSFGIDVPWTDWLAATLHDIVGMGPTYALVVAVAYLPGFLIAAFLLRWVPGPKSFLVCRGRRGGHCHGDTHPQVSGRGHHIRRSAHHCGIVCAGARRRRGRVAVRSTQVLETRRLNTQQSPAHQFQQRPAAHAGAFTPEIPKACLSGQYAPRPWRARSQKSR